MPSRQNYLDKIDQKKKEKMAAGLISERFPQVSEMAMHLTYYHKAADDVLMLRTVNFYSSSYAYFDMECMNTSCTNGGFDLTSVVKNMVKNRKTVQKGKLSCHGDSKILSADHASVSYQINIKYGKK